MPRPPSVAAHEFSARLQALGIDASPERVQKLLEVGLLTRPDQSFPGGGGSSGRYRSELVERAREAVALANEHSSKLHRAVAIMYARGRYAISESKLRRALVKCVNEVSRDLAGAVGLDDVDKEEAAMRAGVVMAKRIARDPSLNEQRRNIPRKKGQKRQATLESITTSSLRPLFGLNPPEGEALVELFRYLGAGGILDSDELSDLVIEIRPTVDTPDVELSDMLAAVKQANQDQLVRARDDALMRAAGCQRLRVPSRIYSQR
jgi:hypothetical protein